QLAMRYHAGGRSEYAAELLSLLLTKYPQHPLADAAALWLVQYYASGEAAWRQRGETRYSVQVASAELPLQSKPAAEQLPRSEQPGRPKVIPADDLAPRAHGVASIGTAAPGMNADDRAMHAIALAKTIEKTRPRLYADPAFRFPLAAAHRRNGQTK